LIVLDLLIVFNILINERLYKRIEMEGNVT